MGNWRGKAVGLHVGFSPREGNRSAYWRMAKAVYVFTSAALFVYERVRSPKQTQFYPVEQYPG